MAEILPIKLQVQVVVGATSEVGADLTRVGGKVMLATDNRVY
jgi:hypothetical protein